MPGPSTTRSLAGLLGQLFTLTDNSSYFTVVAACGIGIGLVLFAGRRPVARLLGAGSTGSADSAGSGR
ncbi:hypothetical protein [Streptomyces sp. NPDC059209]|uniref:hypothetical protein n=1 Tax=Streptomyces sp. NPDC059209 TaxID=3346769 RepID=UPI0036BACA6F